MKKDPPIGGFDVWIMDDLDEEYDTELDKTIKPYKMARSMPVVRECPRCDGHWITRSDTKSTGHDPTKCDEHIVEVILET